MAATKYDIYVFLNGEKVKNSEEMALLVKTLDVSADGEDNGMKISEDTGKFDLNSKQVGNMAAANTNGQAVEYGQYTTALGLKLDASEKGTTDGVATLGPDGKIPSSQVPQIALVDVYVENSEASHLGLTAEEGDVVKRTDLGTTWIHNGGSAGTMSDWTSISAEGAVDTVNGQTGTVVLTTSHISEGSNLYFNDSRARSAAVVNSLAGSQTDQAPSVDVVNGAIADKEDTVASGTTADYYRGDKSFQTLNSTAVAEGANLYFTDARARTAVVLNSITGSQTDRSPSVDAVRLGFGDKEDTIPEGTSTQYYRGTKSWQELNTTAVIEGNNLYYTDERAKDAVGETRELSNVNSGSETIEIGNICYLSAAGEAKLARADESNLGPDVPLYLAKEQVAYGASGEFYAPGKGTYLASLAGFAGMTTNDEFYLDKVVAGSHTNDASGFTTGDHLIRLGKKEAADEIRWDPRYLFEYA